MLAPFAVAVAAAAVLFTCSVSTDAASPAADDVQALDRLTYGANDSSLSAYAEAGRTRFWNAQLRFQGDAALPAAARAQIQALEITRLPVRDLVAAYIEEEHQLQAQSEGEARKAQHKALNERYQFMVEEAQRRRIIRALYSSNQLQEQLTWFWVNHFNVFQGKGRVKLVVADYEETAVRPHVLGRFRDLLLATLMHPAMLLYLDNAQNAKDRINENYARELLELHTLGVDGGYTQKDVEQLARILTGVGVNLEGKPIRPGRRQAPYFVAQGMFAFQPNRHDFGEKVFLGQRIGGRGFDEVVQVVEILAAHPSTARFVSRKLATYFMGDAPPANVLERMQYAFLGSKGDIAHTLQALFDSTEFWQAQYLGRKFKDPVQFVFSAVRLAYDGRIVTNYKPIERWLHELGEPLYGHQTPDGYGMLEKDWASAGQMTVRFEVARQIAGAGPRLFAAQDGEMPAPLAGSTADDAGIAHSEVFALLHPQLSERTRQALAETANPREWTALFLSAPEFMYR